MRKIIFITVLLISSTLFSQTKNPYAIIDQIKDKYAKINDYEVDAIITVDVNFLQVPQSKAKVYYKKPDKIKLESEGFAMLPKQGLNFMPGKLLEDNITAIYTGVEELYQEDTLSTLKIIPNSDTTDVVLSKIWVDTQHYIIRKVETTTKNKGTYAVELYYGTEINAGLPDSLIIKFNISKTATPKDLLKPDKQNKRRRFSGPIIGSVKVEYVNYKVNVGLSDDFFKEEEKIPNN